MVGSVNYLMEAIIIVWRLMSNQEIIRVSYYFIQQLQVVIGSHVFAPISYNKIILRLTK